MANHLNTNKQFMLGNGLLAFAVILVVAIFSYVSLRASVEKKTKRTFKEVYSIELVRGFKGDSIAVYVNDSVVYKGKVNQIPLKIKTNRFAKQSAMAVENLKTGDTSWFDLNEKGGVYKLAKSNEEVSLIGNK